MKQVESEKGLHELKVELKFYKEKKIELSNQLQEIQR
jgi:hypothetical protein